MISLSCGISTAPTMYVPVSADGRQVNGRDYLSRDLEKKARRDGEYAQHITFWFDLKCFLLTIVKVINRQGIAEGAEGKDEKSGSADSDHTNEKRAEGQP